MVGNTYKYDHNEECCKIGAPCHPHTDKSVVFTGHHIPEIKQKHSCHNSSGTVFKCKSWEDRINALHIIFFMGIHKFKLNYLVIHTIYEKLHKLI